MTHSVWETLSKINVNEHTEKKGKFTYLSWSWAWSTLQEHYPESTYSFREVMWFPNNTCEVWVDLQVEGVKREMWLAVTNITNKPITNPSCDMIANARMRCLVKAMAMFGLGHYIYTGESLPMDPEPATADNMIVMQFESCESMGELQTLWASTPNKPLYESAKNSAKTRLESEK